MDKNYLVTKSNYFIMNSSYDLSLEEQKIILTLASMVQPNDEEFKTYEFKIADFMKMLGVSDKSKYTEIPKMAKELMKKVFEIREGKRIIVTAWISTAIYEEGTGYVELQFSPLLKPYMLKLNSMFTQYKLSNILSMKSKYSPRIYEILKCNEFKKQGYIEIEISVLRKLLKCEGTYPAYADFKKRILDKTQEELNKLTDISFEYKEIKEGRKVTSLEFYIKSNIKSSKEDTTPKRKKINTEAIAEIKSIFQESITDLDAKKIYDTAKGDIVLIKSKYEVVGASSNITNVVGAVIKAIKEDWQMPISRQNTSTFNNFKQRDYDFRDLEKKLLGWD